MAVLATSAMAAGTNLLTNGDFEAGGGSLTGWKGQNGTLSLVAGDASANAAKVTRSGTTGTYAIKTAADPVSTAGAGDVYVADGRFNAPSGKNVCFKVKESGTTSKTVTGCTLGTGGWATLAELSYTVVSSGDSLTFFVEQKAAVAGDSFAVDNLSFSTTTSVVAPPTNLQATATSPTEIDLTWNASTTPTVTGYHVFKDDGSQPFATVNAPAHAFEDLTVQPATTHHYMVTAFDGSGESVASNVATATTPSQGGGGGLRIAAAGDIACASSTPTATKCHQQATANLISSRLSQLDSVFTLGDSQYPCGAIANFQTYYDSSWGAFIGKTHPTIGDQDIGASTSCDGKPQNGYFQYFGARAQPNGANGYYYVDLSDGNGADWRVIDLNGNCTSTPCSAGSPQEQFLQNAIYDDAERQLHHGRVAPAVLQRLEPERAFGVQAVLGRSLCGTRGAHPERARPLLRALQAAEPERGRRSGQRDHRDHRRHRRGQPRVGEGHLAQHRRLRQPRLGRDLPDAERDLGRLAVRERGRPDRRQRHALLHAQAVAPASGPPLGDAGPESHVTS